MKALISATHGTPAWERAFRTAIADPKLYPSLLRYACERARFVEPRVLGNGYVDDLIQDAIDDTYLGVLAWDPAVVSLLTHLRWVIRSRTSKAYRRARRFPHDELNPDDDCFLDLEAEARHELRRRAQEVLDAFRHLAAGDAHVLLLLAAYEESLTRRGEVLAFTGLTHHEYLAARHRLARMRNDIPNRLCSNQ